MILQTSAVDAGELSADLRVVDERPAPILHVAAVGSLKRQAQALFDELASHGTIKVQAVPDGSCRGQYLVYGQRKRGRRVDRSGSADLQDVEGRRRVQGVHVLPHRADLA